jgi:uncharacterized protein (TIGR02453 family)
MGRVFEGFSQRTIDFMWDLRLNNEKEWFEAHKEDFIRDFQAPMKELGGEVFEWITENYGDHGFIYKLSRIYRDARRVRGGEPYRSHLWFSIERPSEEWMSSPGFWFELTPENWSYGLGYYLARPMTMAKLRARIGRNPAKFEKLIAPLEKQDEFVLDGPEYARQKDAPTKKTAVWCQKKSFALTHWQENGEELFSAELSARLIRGYQFLMPFYDYFITLDSDPNPE